MERAETAVQSNFQFTTLFCRYFTAILHRDKVFFPAGSFTQTYHLLRHIKIIVNCKRQQHCRLLTGGLLVFIHSLLSSTRRQLSKNASARKHSGKFMPRDREKRKKILGKHRRRSRVFDKLLNYILCAECIAFFRKKRDGKKESRVVVCCIVPLGESTACLWHNEQSRLVMVKC